MKWPADEGSAAFAGKKEKRKSDVPLKMNQNLPPVKAVFSYLITSEYFPVSDDDNPASDIDAHLPL